MISATLFRFRCMASGIEAEADKLNQRGLSRAAGANNNVKSRRKCDIETIQNTLFNLNTLNVHASPP